MSNEEEKSTTEEVHPPLPQAPHKYWNTNGMQIAIVCVIYEECPLWCCFIGATKDAYYEHETVDWTKRYGDQLYIEDVKALFPSFAAAMEAAGYSYGDL